MSHTCIIEGRTHACLGCDPYLANTRADMTAYVLLESALCDCDGLCVCGWDD